MQVTHSGKTTLPGSVWKIGSPLQRKFIACIEGVVLQKLESLQVLHEMGKKILVEQNNKLNQESKQQKSLDEVNRFYSDHKDDIEKIAFENGQMRLDFRNTSYVRKVLKKGSKVLSEADIDLWEKNILSYSDAKLLNATANSSSEKIPQQLGQRVINYTDECVGKLKNIVRTYELQYGIKRSGFGHVQIYKIAHYCASICSITQMMKADLLKFHKNVESNESFPEDILNHILTTQKGIQATRPTKSRRKRSSSSESPSSSTGTPIVPKKTSRSASLSLTPSSSTRKCYMDYLGSLKEMVSKLAEVVSPRDDILPEFILGHSPDLAPADDVEFTEKILLMNVIFSKYKKTEVLQHSKLDFEKEEVL